MNNRDNVFAMRMTEEERQALENLAEENGLNMTQFVRSRIFKNKINEIEQNILYIRNTLDDIKEQIKVTTYEGS